MMKLNYPASPFATAFNVPLDDAIQRMVQSARQLDESANKMAKEHDQHARNNFGQRIADAVKRKVAKQPTRITAAATDDDESFGAKLKRAVKSAQKQRSGYRKLPVPPDEG